MFCTYGVGGGVFLIAYEDFWRKVVKSIPTSAISFFFFLSFFFVFVLFFEWSMAHVHWFHFLGQDQSTVAQQAETTIAESSLMSYMSAHFPWQVLTPCLGTAWSVHSNLLGQSKNLCIMYCQTYRLGMMFLPQLCQTDHITASTLCNSETHQSQ